MFLIVFEWNYLESFSFQQLPAPYSPECSSNSSDFTRPPTSAVSCSDISPEVPSDSVLEGSVQSHSSNAENEASKGRWLHNPIGVDIIFFLSRVFYITIWFQVTQI